MINLTLLDKNYFKLEIKKHNINETFINDKVYIMWKNYGLDEEELDYALEQMYTKRHRLAHFGSTGSFIFSK